MKFVLFKYDKGSHLITKRNDKGSPLNHSDKRYHLSYHFSFGSLLCPRKVNELTEERKEKCTSVIFQHQAIEVAYSAIKLDFTVFNLDGRMITRFLYLYECCSGPPTECFVFHARAIETSIPCTKVSNYYF